MGKLLVNEEAVAAVAAIKARDSAEEWFSKAIEDGFTSSDGIRLGLSEADVTLLTGNFVLAKEAAALGADLPPVIDRDGVPHSLDIEDLTALMLEYGQHRASLSVQYNKIATGE